MIIADKYLLKTCQCALAISLLVTAIPSMASRTISELEKLDYDEMVLTGTAQSGKTWIACLQTSKGKQLTVKTGDFLGLRLGQIKKVDAKGIHLTETIPINFNEWLERKFFWPVVSDKSMRAACKWTAAPEKIFT